MPRRSVLTPLLGPGLVALLISACSDASCGDLTALTVERDEARASFAEVVKRVEVGSASEEELDAAHDVMHALDKRVNGLAQSCN